MSQFKVSKADYEAIRKSVSKWPQWKKDYCNQHVIKSVRAKKI